MADDEVLFDDVYELCEIIGKWVTRILQNEESENERERERACGFAIDREGYKEVLRERESAMRLDERRWAEVPWACRSRASVCGCVDVRERLHLCDPLIRDMMPVYVHRSYIGVVRNEWVTTRKVGEREMQVEWRRRAGRVVCTSSCLLPISIFVEFQSVNSTYHHTEKYHFIHLNN